MLSNAAKHPKFKTIQEWHQYAQKRGFNPAAPKMPDPPKTPDPRKVETSTKWVELGHEDARAQMEIIRTAVCLSTGVSTTEFLSRRRSTEITFARKIFYWLCKKKTLASLPQIGRMAGRRDHSTVHHGCKVVERDFKRYAEAIAEAESYLRAVS